MNEDWVKKGERGETRPVWNDHEAGRRYDEGQRKRIYGTGDRQPRQPPAPPPPKPPEITWTPDSEPMSLAGLVILFVALPVIVALIAGAYGAWYYHGGFARPAIIAAEISAAVVAVAGLLGGTWWARLAVIVPIAAWLILHRVGLVPLLPPTYH